MSVAGSGAITEPLGQKSQEAERTRVAKAARDTYIVHAMVALIGKSALTPRSPFAVPPVNPLHPTSVDMAPRNPLNISTWQSFASTAVPPRDPNNNDDEEEEDNGGEADEDREPAVIREPDEDE